MSRRFKKPKTREEESACVVASIPRNTKYQTKWSVTLFCDWQKQRENKKAANECTSFNFTTTELLQDVDTSLDDMNAETLNFWMIKFVQEVAKKNG